jgi:hypothetical protein
VRSRLSEGLTPVPIDAKLVRLDPKL